MRVAAALDAGVDRIFWAFLQDRNIPGDALAQTVGLITVDGQRKPAFAAYQELITEALESLPEEEACPAEL